MFKRRRNQTTTPPQREPFTYVHRGTTISGELSGSGRVRVHGTVRGNVRVDGVLEVAEAGLVEGSWVVADEVKIIGTVKVESLTAHGKVEIWRGGELVGDVQAAALDIEEGARFTGRSEMTTVGSTDPVSGELTNSKAAQDAPDAAARVSPAAESEQRPGATLELLGQADDALI